MLPVMVRRTSGALCVVCPNCGQAVPPEELPPVGKALRQYRLRTGMSQRAIAASVPMPQSMITYAEAAGRTDPKRLLRLLTIYGVTDPEEIERLTALNEQARRQRWGRG